MKRSVIALVLLCLVAVIFLSSMSSQTSAESHQGTSLLTRVERLETQLSEFEQSNNNTHQSLMQDIKNLAEELKQLRAEKEAFWSTGGHAFMKSGTENGFYYEFLIAPHGELVLRKVRSADTGTEGQMRVDIYPN